jgi:thymidylate kinase
VPYPEIMTMSGDPYLFRELVAAFDDHELQYCILAGYDTYPDSIASDVDFMVLPADAPRIPAILAAVAARSGSRLVQCIAHETTAAWFVIARQGQASLSFLHPDLSTDYRRRGRLWLRAQDMVTRRRRHPRGFWIPSTADAFIYYLIKKLDKGAISSAQADELKRRYQSAPGAAHQLLEHYFPARGVDLIERALQGRDHASLGASLDTLRDQLHSRAPAEPLLQRLRQFTANGMRLANRLQRPTGLSIAFLGPDGCGKSSVIDQVRHDLRNVFRRVEYQHLRPRPLARGDPPANAPIVDPHGQKARGTAGSVAKLLHFWSTYLIGTLLWTFPRRVSSTLVIFDRYYHDLLADPHRYRYGAQLRWARLLGLLVPEPELVFILDAPPQVVQARKQEVPFAESERQRRAYLDLAPQLREAHVIDATQPLDKVVADVVAIVLARLESRAAARLNLPLLAHVAGD